MSVVDTSKLLAESHSIIYGPNENNGCDVTLESIHSLLIQMNTKLTNIELKNDSLESRLSTIEKEIIALNEIRGSLDTVKSHVNKLNTDVTSEVKIYFCHVSYIYFCMVGGAICFKR